MENNFITMGRDTGGDTGRDMRRKEVRSGPKAEVVQKRDEKWGEGPSPIERRRTQ
jgi:hypothetical protein